jgi:hypothetical protein
MTTDLQKIYNKFYTKVYREKNKALLSERSRQHYQHNKDKIKAGISSWKESNPEKVRAQRQRYYKKRFKNNHMELYCLAVFLINQGKSNDVKNV